MTLDGELRHVHCAGDSEISAALAKQGDGVAKASHAVPQVQQPTLQNAALLEACAAASSLRTQAQQLVDAVAIFKLSGSKA